MPGTNHELEHTFLDSLSLKDRPIAQKILESSHLHDMILFQQKGLPNTITNLHSRSNEQWQVILNKSILTKLSYFTPTDKMSLKHIELLTRIACFALDRPGLTLYQLQSMLKTSHLYFSNWAGKLNEIRERKLKS